MVVVVLSWCGYCIDYSRLTASLIYRSSGAGGGGGSEVTPGHVKLVKRGNKMEVLL